jgi:hypothetical protein
MLNNYVKNRGTTQTIIRKNNKNHFNEINWDADYDGNIANISVDTNINGTNRHMEFNLDNQDLSNILNIPSVNLPIHKRLEQDFMTPSFTNPTFSNDKIIYQIEIPNKKKQISQSETSYDTDSISSKPKNYISSPLSNEELLVPITINEKTNDDYTFTPRRRNRRIKTHKTHRLYKRQKSSNPKHKRNYTHSKGHSKGDSKGKNKFTIF